MQHLTQPGAIPAPPGRPPATPDKVAKPTGPGRAMLDNMLAGHKPWATPRWIGKNISVVLNTLVRHGWAKAERVDGDVRWVVTPAGKEALK